MAGLTRITFVLPGDLRAEALALATQEHRTIGNLLRYLLRREIEADRRKKAHERAREQFEDRLTWPTTMG